MLLQNNKFLILGILKIEELDIFEIEKYITYKIFSVYAQRYRWSWVKLNRYCKAKADNVTDDFI